MSRLLHISREERLEAGGGQDIAPIRTRGRLRQEISVRVHLMVVRTLACWTVTAQRAYQTWSLLQEPGRSRHEPGEVKRMKEEFEVALELVGEGRVETGVSVLPL